MSKPNAILAMRCFTRKDFRETAMDQFSSIAFVIANTIFHPVKDQYPFFKDPTTGT